MGLRHALVGLVVGFSLASCSTEAKFPYRYYALDAASYDGDLRGPKPADDKALKLCEPTPATPNGPAIENKCLVMFKDEFLQMKADYKKMQVDLEACQAGALKGAVEQ